MLLADSPGGVPLSTSPIDFPGGLQTHDDGAVTGHLECTASENPLQRGFHPFDRDTPKFHGLRTIRGFNACVCLLGYTSPAGYCQQHLLIEPVQRSHGEPRDNGIPRIQQLQIHTAYRLTLPRRVLNRIVRLWIRLGLPPRKYHVLTVKGRRSGRSHSTPVSVVVVNGKRWLVAPYGPRNWVKNARAAGQVRLSRGAHSEVLTVEEEHDPTRCGPVLKLYFDQEPITRRFFDAKPGAPIEAFAAEAHRHPVFRVLKPDQ